MYGTSSYGSIGDEGCPQITLESVTAYEDRLELLFDNVLHISGDAANPTKYTVTPIDNGYSSTVTAVAISDTNARTLVLSITRQTNEKNYTLTLPSFGIQSIELYPFYGPFDKSYTAVGVGPGIQIVRTVDARTIDVIFNTQVNPSEALDPNNYTVTPTIKVKSVKYITDYWYQLTTERQIVDQAYTVEIDGIHDINGNAPVDH